MRSLAHSAYLDSEVGIPTDLMPAGTALENPYVYDNAARELKSLADRGLLRIVGERVRADGPGSLIERISFAKLR